MSKEISIVFGALAEKIGKQLSNQGATLQTNDVVRFEKMVWSITYLHLHGIIPDSVRDNAREKVMKQISIAIHKEQP